MSTFDPENPFGLPDLDPADADRLRNHIDALVREHGLQWREEDIGWLDAEGALGENWFRSPVLRDEFSYLVALHEVGHHVLGLPTDDENGDVVFANEVDVWEWALAEAIVEPSEAARAQVRVCLISYPDQTPQTKDVARLRSIAPPGGNTDMRWRSSGRESATVTALRRR